MKIHKTTQCFIRSDEQRIDEPARKTGAFSSLARQAGLAVLIALIVLIAGISSARAAAGTNTEDDFKGSAGTSLLTPGNWSTGALPTVSTDATFNSSTAPGIETLSSGNLTVGSFDVSATTGTYSIRDESVATNYTLTLGGTGDNGDKISGTTADLLWAATGSTFNLRGDDPNGTGALQILLGQSGSFHASGTIGISAVISDGGNGYGITKSGGGILILGAVNTYSGGTTINNGTVQFANAAGATGTGTLGSTSGTLTINGGSNTGYLDLTGTNQTVGNFTGSGGYVLNSTASTNVTLTIGSGNGTGGTFAGVIENNAGTGGTVAITKIGTGTLTLSGNNTFSSGVTVNQGTLTGASGQTAFGTGNVLINPTGTSGTSADAATANISGASINSTAILTVNSNVASSAFAIGTANFTTSSPKVGALSGNGSVVLGTGTGVTTLVIGSSTNNLSSTFSGVISEGINVGDNVTKAGTGTLTLTGGNSYAGTTTINVGVLSLANASGAALTGTSSVAVNSTGTLQMGAANQFNATTPAPVMLTGATGTGTAATFSVNGNSQGSTTANGVGALTLANASVNNVLDFGQKAAVITFAGFNPNGAVLTINNYVGTGSPVGTGALGSNDELIFNTNVSTETANFNFGFGAGTDVGVQQIGTSGFYEVYSTVPIPEPATVIGGLLMAGALGWKLRRRLAHRVEV